MRREEFLDQYNMLPLSIDVRENLNTEGFTPDQFNMYNELTGKAFGILGNKPYTSTIDNTVVESIRFMNAELAMQAGGYSPALYSVLQYMLKNIFVVEENVYLLIMALADDIASATMLLSDLVEAAAKNGSDIITIIHVMAAWEKYPNTQDQTFKDRVTKEFETPLSTWVQDSYDLINLPLEEQPNIQSMNHCFGYWFNRCFAKTPPYFVFDLSYLVKHDANGQYETEQDEMLISMVSFYLANLFVPYYTMAMPLTVQLEDDEHTTFLILANEYFDKDISAAIRSKDHQALAKLVNSFEDIIQANPGSQVITSSKLYESFATFIKELNESSETKAVASELHEITMLASGRTDAFIKGGKTDV